MKNVYLKGKTLFPLGVDPFLDGLGELESK